MYKCPECTRRHRGGPLVAPDAVFSQSATTASLRQGSRIKSSTFLQMLIYFNAYYSLAQAILSALILRWKSANGKDTAASSAVLALWAAFEIPRLYAGSVGNLKEKVPHLGGFYFLTVTQACLLVYLVAFQAPLMPIDRVVFAVSLTFEVFELIVGMQTLCAIARDKTARFSVEVHFGGVGGEQAAGQGVVDPIDDKKRR